MLTCASSLQEVINEARNKAETFLNHYNHNRRSSTFKSSMGRRQSSFAAEALQVCSRMLAFACRWTRLRITHMLTYADVC
jgi:hypothetical protein